MPQTQIKSSQLQDGGVQREDINVSVSGHALITKIIAGTGLTESHSGVDAGTGDVTLSLGNHSAALITSGNIDIARLPASGDWSLNGRISALGFNAYKTTLAVNSQLNVGDIFLYKDGSNRWYLIAKSADGAGKAVQLATDVTLT
jgi:hypothetical protein